tara:strand:+ start:84 stop:197 length:114 start_codon:yes stop_codon:yes gene_type:complete
MDQEMEKLMEERHKLIDKFCMELIEVEKTRKVLVVAQ